MGRASYRQAVALACGKAALSLSFIKVNYSFILHLRRRVHESIANVAFSGREPSTEATPEGVV